MPHWKELTGLTPTLLFATGMFVITSQARAAPPDTQQGDSGSNMARRVAVPYKDAVERPGMKGLAWTGDLALALTRGCKDKKLVFVEFTAATNVNGAYNHREILTRSAVKEALGPYVLTMLYVDLVPAEFIRDDVSEEKRHAEGEANGEYERRALRTARIPLYVILKPVADGGFEVVARYEEGRIEQPDRFVDFLRAPSGSDK